MPRSHRSGNTYIPLPPPPPPPPPRIPAPSVITNQQYHLIDGMNIPAGLARKRVAECHLEFINFANNNHCVLRLTFLHQLEDDTPYAPIGTRGVILDFEGVTPQASSTSGELMLCTFGYEGPHRNSLHFSQIPMGRNKTVGDCVRIIRDSDLVPCDFDHLNENLVGCRDFMWVVFYFWYVSGLY